MSAQHTPAPWTEIEMPSNCCDEIVADDGSGRVICEFPYGLDANSAHIVRAVNAHDDLVAALRGMRDAMRRSFKDGYLDFGEASAPDYLDEAEAAAVSALAKAEEGAK